MRQKILFATWKDRLTVSQSVDLAKSVVRRVSNRRLSILPVICPSFVALPAVSQIVQGTNVKLAGQNMRWDDPKITITGEIPPETLVEVGCDYVIIGHSERRIYLGETNDMVRLKVSSALKWGLVPVICVGERYHEREDGTYLEVVEKQIRAAIAGLKESRQGRKIVFAYEPAWSISTSPIARPIDPQEANRMHRFVREILSRSIQSDFGRNVTVVYGGSVNKTNVGRFFSQPEIDGGLVGTASQTVNSFSKLVEVANTVFSSKSPS